MSSDSKHYNMKKSTVCAKEKNTKVEFTCLENIVPIKKDIELGKFIQPIEKAPVRQREGVDAMPKAATVPKTSSIDVQLAAAPPPPKGAGKGAKKGKKGR